MARHSYRPKAAIALAVAGHTQVVRCDQDLIFPPLLEWWGSAAAPVRRLCGPVLSQPSARAGIGAEWSSCAHRDSTRTR
jgi:hypothetical protein